MAVPGVSVLWQLKTKFHAGRAVPVYEHGFFHLMYVKSGKLHLVTKDDKLTVLHPGEMALFPPDVAHGFSVPTAQDVVGAELKLVISTPELLAMLQDLPYVFPCTPNALLALQQMENYFNNTPANSIGSDIYSGTINAYASLLLYSIIEEYTAAQAANPQNTVAAVVEQYINEHYSEKILLDELVPLTGHNKSYTCALYKKERGYTINDYIKKLRITKACEMLAERDFKISEVASACGFKTVAHFSYTFKEVVGVPPSQYSNYSELQMS